MNEENLHAFFEMARNIKSKEEALNVDRQSLLATMQDVLNLSKVGDIIDTTECYPRDKQKKMVVRDVSFTFTHTFNIKYTGKILKKDGSHGLYRGTAIIIIKENDIE